MNGIHLSGDLQPMVPKRQKLEDRLRALTHKADIMVFMKGDPEVNIRVAAEWQLRQSMNNS